MQSIALKITIKKISTGEVKDLTPFVTSFNCTLAKSQSANWSLSLASSCGLLSPYRAGTWYDWLRPNVHTSVGIIDKVINVSYFMGGVETFLPLLIPLQKEWKADKDGHGITLSGTDITKLLYQKNQTMASAKSAFGSIVYAREAMRGVLNQYGITSHNLTFTDFPIALWEFQAAQPMGKIIELLAVPVAEWGVFYGTTFEAFDNRFKKDGPSDFDYVDNKDIFLLSESEAMLDIINEVQVIRTKVSKVAGEMEVNQPGRYTCTFNYPVYSPFAIIENRFCYIDPGPFVPPDEAIQYFDSSGVYRAPPGGSPITEAMFTVFVDPWGVGGKMSFKITFGGQAAGVDPPLGIIDDEYNITVVDQASQALYGRCPDDSPIVNPLIPDSAMALLHGTRKIRENNREYNSLNWGGRFNPLLRPCMTIGIRESVGGIEDFFYVESVAFSSTQDTHTQQFTACRYQT